MISNKFNSRLQFVHFNFDADQYTIKIKHSDVQILQSFVILIHYNKIYTEIANHALKNKIKLPEYDMPAPTKLKQANQVYGKQN